MHAQKDQIKSESPPSFIRNKVYLMQAQNVDRKSTGKHFNIAVSNLQLLNHLLFTGYKKQHKGIKHFP